MCSGGEREEGDSAALACTEGTTLSVCVQMEKERMNDEGKILVEALGLDAACVGFSFSCCSEGVSFCMVFDADSVRVSPGDSADVSVLWMLAEIITKDVREMNNRMRLLCGIRDGLWLSS